MIRMGTIWDRTVEVLSGRTAILTSLAALYFFLPNVVSSAVTIFSVPEGAPGPEPTWRLIGMAVSLAVLLLLIFGMLAITAVASDPEVNQARATAIAGRRIGAALLVVVVIMAAVAIVFLPAGVLFATSGMTMTASGQPDMANADGGRIGMAFLLGAIGLIVGLWISARLVPLFPVVVNEGVALSAFRRSFTLTRGSTARLVGVIILYAIVTVVVLMAATMVTGAVAGLILGPQSRVAGFIVALVSAALTAGVTVVQAVFYARFYVAATQREGAPDPAP